MLVSFFQNLKSPYVERQMDILSILDLIQKGHYKDQVELARYFGKGHPEYTRIKELLPTFTPNASFIKKRCFENLENLSGFIYLDVDMELNESLLLNYPFVFSFWKSISNTGYAVLVNVDNLTIENFRNTWDYIASYLRTDGIFVDAKTKDITRQNVLSSSDVYINPSCQPLNAYELLNNSSSTGCVNLITVNSELTLLPDFINYTTTGLTSDVIYKTFLSNYNGKDYVIIPEGKEYRNAYLPKEIKEGERHQWLVGYILTILFNNRDIHYELILNIALKANNEHCKPKLSFYEIKSMVDWWFSKHLKGQLDYNTKKKKIWFNPESELSLSEKRKIVGKESGNLRRSKTIYLLQEKYNELKFHGRVTQKLLSEISGKSIRTIKNYWKYLN